MAGMWDIFKPAPLTHKHPLIQRVAKMLGIDQPNILRTTEQGSASTASPSTFQMGALSLRYERMAYIADIRRMLLDDPRAARANKKYAREAVRKDILVSVTPTKGSGKRVAKKAKEIIDQINQDCQINSKKIGWAMMLLAEGDLFVQPIVQGNQVINVKRMPAIGMERNTDETDGFLDVTKAFTQIDITTQTNIADFALWQIIHERWNYVDGERYGVPEYMAARGASKKLDLMETAQVVRRITRASMKHVHTVGTPENPGKKTEIEEYKELNGLGNNLQAAFDPLEQVNNFFSNGLTKVETLEGDPKVHEIEDIKHMQDVFYQGLGVPKAVVAADSENLNRDVVKDQRAEWLKEVSALADSIANVLRQVYELALLLQGINPESVNIGIRFAESSMDSSQDRADRVVKLRQANVGQGMRAIPSPLISAKRALSVIAEDIGVDDVDAELEQIEKELEEDGIKDFLEQQMQTPPVGQAGFAGNRPNRDTNVKVQNPSNKPGNVPKKTPLTRVTDAAPDVAVVAVTRPDGKMLVVKRSLTESSRPGFWEVPGGHLEPGETAEDGAIREVKEETGLDIVLGQEWVPFVIPNGGLGVFMRGFLVGGDLRLDKSELDSAKWVKPEDALKLSPTPPGFAEQVRQVVMANKVIYLPEKTGG